MSVRVVARIRPLLKQEIEKDTIVEAASSGVEAPASPTVVKIPNPKNDAEKYSFQFSGVYDQESTQQELFDKEVSPTVKHLFNGFDVTIFAYGVTGTGKTHTMRGGKVLAERGVIPRYLSSLFRRMRKVEKDSAGETDVKLAMSYYEIYNDKVYDLFEPPEKRTPTGLPIRDNHGKTVVVGLTERPCTSLKDFEQLYDQANMNRSTAGTKLNAHSSRSHAILCVKLTQTTGDAILVSRASAIDLAGSEDNRRTDNNKERLIESSAINKSLFTLAQCVEAISKKQHRIPYRESKMTRILSLGQNNGFTLMILNLAPVRGYHLDTLSSLNFANRTKKIEVNEVENAPEFVVQPKPNAIGSGIPGANVNRQPLRPKASVHNTLRTNNTQQQAAEKPVKSFNVYSDDNKPSLTRASTISNTSARRSVEPPKPKPSGIPSTRPIKPVRPNIPPKSASQPAGLSESDVAAMIDARVAKILAEKALDSKTVDPVAALPEELQQRLSALEKRVEKTEDTSQEGLHYLLMAKQHQARGENASALRMLELAVPHFPNNEKLEKKIKLLRVKLNGDIFEPEEAMQPQRPASMPTTSSAFSLPISVTSKPQQPKAKKVHRRHESSEIDDDSFHASEDGESEDDEYRSDGSVTHKKRKTTSKTLAKPKVAVFRDLSSSSAHGRSSSLPVPNSSNALEQSPRTSHIIKLVNTKDVSKIKSLKGVGAKKAEAIVGFVLEMEDGEVRDLESLAEMKGVGVKGVENMRNGLAGMLGLESVSEEKEYDF